MAQLYNINSEKIWKTIPHDSKGFDFVKRLVPLKSKREISLAYHYPGMELHILLDLPKSLLPKNIPQAEGFRIKLLSVPGENNLRRLSITLSEEKFEKTFYKITDMLLQSLEGIDNDQKLINTLFNELKNFQDFFQKLNNRKGLSENSQQGLFAELDFIEKDLLSNLSVKETLSAWQSPHKAPHDFSRKGKVVEIKSTIDSPAQKIKIANEYQLDDGALEKLYLCTSEVVKNVNIGITINEKIKTIRKKIKSLDPESLNLFNILLVKSGYFEEHVDYYSSLFRIGRKIFHHVQNGFPRLIASALPAGVDSVNYKINLNYCHDYLVPKRDALDTFCR